MYWQTGLDQANHKQEQLAVVDLQSISIFSPYHPSISEEEEFYLFCPSRFRSVHLSSSDQEYQPVRQYYLDISELPKKGRLLREGY